MINLLDGELLDLLPASMKSDTDMVCLSYALKEITQDLLKTLSETRTQSFIDGLPERILDVLAVETNAMYYDESLPIQSKRSIIKASMSAWYARAGTPAAVEELVQAVFGEGSVVEWYDFTEGEPTPGLFDIKTNAPPSEDILSRFEEIIRRVKNERSHLRRVLIERNMKAAPFAGVYASSTPPNVVIDNTGREERNISAAPYIGVGVFTYPVIVIGG